jgi:mono/diheme cytochrome c family protein
MNAVMPWPTLAVAAIALLGCSVAASRSPADGQDFAQVERGRYLATAADCAACHDDPVDHRRFAGGLAIETPFGVVIAPNITPDRDTGIGAWSDAQFDAVLRRGRLPDGKRVYPAMPFPYYTKMSAADVRAIRAYLSTVPAVNHRVVSDQLPFPFSIRASMLVWDALYFSPGQYQSNAAKSADWNRGAFLVNGPGHCGACHTPKTLLGGDEASQELQGDEIQGWFAPDITGSQRTGVGGWSATDIVEYLQTGHNRFAAASGPMAEEISNSSSHWSTGDLADVAAYLKDHGADSGQQARAEPAGQPAPDDPRMAAGAAIYGDLCSSCHRSDGAGVPHLIPNLAASSSVASRDPATLIRVVLLGANSVATAEEPTAPAMPSFAWQLSDAEVAAVTTYIRNTWNHAAAAVTAGEVHDARTKLLAAGR